MKHKKAGYKEMVIQALFSNYAWQLVSGLGYQKFQLIVTDSNISYYK